MKNKFYHLAVVSLCSLMAACSGFSSGSGDRAGEKAAVTSEWMSSQEILLRDSIKGSPFTLRKQDNAWIVTAPAQQSFNPDRPSLLLPSVLGPITRISKMLEANPDVAVLILGHTDALTNTSGNYTLSADRARSVASIFRLSGLKGGRMMHFGLGDSYALYNQKNAAQNHRVEIVITPNTHMQDVVAVYRPAHVRQLALTESR